MKKATICDYARMCKNHKDCRSCLLSVDINEMSIACLDLVKDYPDKANEIILKWCEEHPVKTRQDRFLKMFPNALLFDGVLNICPECVKGECGHSGTMLCKDCKKDYWLAEVDENE